jgi:hypothetical protein
MSVDPYLADKFALQELCAKYSRAVDRRDFALLRSLYHEDSTDEHGSMFAGDGGDFVDYVSRTVTQFESTAHYITNMLFMVEGTKAEGEVYKINYHRTKPPERMEIITGSRSHDRYERRNGVWKFMYRGISLDWARQVPVDDVAYTHFAAGSPPGQPDETDLSYARLSMFMRGVL